MMAGNPSWWSMQSELRSTSDQQHHHHHHQHEQVVVEEEEANNSNLFMSQTHHNHHHHPSNNSLLPLHHHHHQQYLHGSSSSTSHSSSLMPFISLVDHQHAQDFPHSWSQLLLGGMASEQEEERFSTTAPSHFQSTRVMSNDVKAEVNTPTSNNNNNNNNNNNSNNNTLYESQYLHEEQQQEGSSSVGISNNNNNNNRAWTQLMPVSSPKSCITSLNNNNHINTNDNNINTNNNNNISTSNNNSMLDFSTNKRALQVESHQHADHSNSECNSPATTGGLPKKPRLQSSSNPPLKVRKEKLGDRITSLHQLVSPFGKTDTASVLLEAIGYIRFLQGQIEALSSPYLGSNTPSMKNTHNIHGERTCLFPDHPGQLLNDSCLKRRGAANQEEKEAAAGGGRKDELKSRGLCLVPISCTQLIGSENGADYWAQSLGGGF